MARESLFFNLLLLLSIIILTSSFSTNPQSHYRRIRTTDMCGADSIAGESVKRSSLSHRRRERRAEVGQDRLARKGDTEASSFESDIQRPSNEQAPALCTSELGLHLITQNSLRFYGFDDLFPGKGISELFDTSSSFRNDIRSAARKDFFVPDERLSAQANLALKDPRSTLMSSWKKKNEYYTLSEVFRKHSIDISGEEFISKFTSFCSSSSGCFGSWIDICGVKNKHVQHSWHQDSGLDQITVMVGFPSCDHYDGIGVFSHAFKISHHLPPPPLAEPRLWHCGKNSHSLGEKPTRIPEQYIIRPVFRKGKEVMVYNDRDLFHSAPDRTNRESVWRFM